MNYQYMTPTQRRNEFNRVSVRLTHRELEVLRLISVGYPSRNAADILCVSKSTIDYHLANVFRKLDVDNRMKAVEEARKLGLLPWEPQGS